MGAVAPAFILPTETGQPVSLEGYRGRVVLLNFWASWCPPCVAEMPSLERLKKAMEGKDFAIVAVSVDDRWADVDRFKQTVPLTLTVLWDQGFQVAGRFGTYRLPETYLLDKKGVVVKRYLGPRDWTDPKLVAEILNYVEEF